MPTIPTSAAVSHVGKVRASNQDSGYLGRHLYLVADGMGGHAGGDVASHIATQRIAEADQPYASTDDASEVATLLVALARTRQPSEIVLPALSPSPAQPPPQQPPELRGAAPARLARER